MEDIKQIQRSAADAPPLSTTAPRSVFDWRPAGTPATPISNESEPMKTATQSPQTMICKVLANREGSWPRADLRKACSTLEDKPFHQAIYNAVKNKRVRRNGDAYEITKDGLSWITSEEKFLPPRAKAMPPKPVAKSRAKGVTAPVRAPQERAQARINSFKCAEFSDGTFMLEKDGSAISLSPDEYQSMRTYLESH